MAQILKTGYLLSAPVTGTESFDLLVMNLEIDAASGNEKDLLIDGNKFLNINA